MKTQTQIDIAIDELFGNIAHYAYNPDVEPTDVSPSKRAAILCLTVILSCVITDLLCLFF